MHGRSSSGMGEILRQDDARWRVCLAHDALGEALAGRYYGGARCGEAGEDRGTWDRLGVC